MFFDPMKVDTIDNIGDNWEVGMFTGNDSEDGRKYIVTTDHVRASELQPHTAKDHAYLFAAAPYLFHQLAEVLDFTARVKNAVENGEEYELPQEAERLKEQIKNILDSALSPELRELAREES